MGDFWFWFARPFAELAGSFALIGAVLAVCFIAFHVYVAYLWVRSKIRRFFHDEG